ncbi:hypothetical protein CEXT_673121 [Caerostris extrusa]|uniref:Uncharacterized protein n=1 Tax=Caerostris extrusa TaxID=172846 RepID=A0AAV4UK12_CAEEX|nr:hypothetical protein CEXT_673121 [Caerostris extrusa]
MGLIEGIFRTGSSETVIQGHGKVARGRKRVICLLRGDFHGKEEVGGEKPVRPIKLRTACSLIFFTTFKRLSSRWKAHSFIHILRMHILLLEPLLISIFISLLAPLCGSSCTATGSPTKVCGGTIGSWESSRCTGSTKVVEAAEKTPKNPPITTNITEHGRDTKIT